MADLARLAKSSDLSEYVRARRSEDDSIEENVEPRRFVIRGGYCTQAQDFFARLTTQPTSARKVLYNTAIAGLVSAGLYSKLDAYGFLAAADAATAKTNLISSSYALTEVNAPTFTADIGYTAAATKKLTASFAGASKFTQNAASFFVWQQTGYNATALGMMGDDDGSNYIYGDNGSFFWRINQGSDSSLSSLSPSAAGLVVVVRDGASFTRLYQNGAQIATGNVTSAASADNDWQLLIDGPLADQGSGTLAAWGFGGLLSATDVANLTSITRAYLQGVGAA